jgi:malonate decarboxylase beta subunit
MRASQFVPHDVSYVGGRETASWYEASARQRVSLLLDAGSFQEFVGPTAREMSPHLEVFGLPEQFDDGIIVGRGRIDGAPVFLAAQEGRFMGGAFGEVHGAKLTGLLRAARDVRRSGLLRAESDFKSIPVFILFDTGGVRLQEANAGELAIAEIMRALIGARVAGVKVIGLVGGRAGCYGGGGLIAGCCSALVVSEQGRIAVSGPEVIETNRGVEEFDSKDRALVWRTMGGKHRRLLGGADAFADDTIQSFRDAALHLIKVTPGFGIDVLKAEQSRLEERLQRFGSCTDALDIWRAEGIADADAVSAMPSEQFIDLADKDRRLRYDAR